MNNKEIHRLKCIYGIQQLEILNLKIIILIITMKPF